MTIPSSKSVIICCRDLGNGVRLSYICRSKEQAAYRITQFLRADIARPEIDYTNAEACLEQAGALSNSMNVI